MSSELQEIIASQAIKAFNQGLSHGAKSERDRIIKMLEAELTKQFGWSSDCDCKECPALSKLIQQMSVNQND